MQVHRGLSTGFIALNHHLQPRLTAGRQGHFRHCEQAVEQNQKENERGIH